MTKRLDGSYILSGKAENFVAGWCADIAYTRLMWLAIEIMMDI
ncbi:hypothetical protein ACMT1J_001218 [Campylobacter jejuni]|nr:hypothetical protein [Campylobacter jejuni]